MTTIETVSPFGGSHPVVIDPYGPNPLVEMLKQSHPDVFAAASQAAGPPPQLFSNGVATLPAFSSSGLDVSLLALLPYSARHFAAAEPDMARVHALFEDAAGDPYYGLSHEGLDAATSRVRDWAAGRMDKPGAVA